MADSGMVDLVLFALDSRKDSKTLGKELPGTLVRLMRFPDNVMERVTGRASGPWQHIRGGFHSRFRLVEKAGVKGRMPRKELEPCAPEIISKKDGTTFTVDMTLQPDHYAAKATDTSGTVMNEKREFAPFSMENAKYIKDVCLFHFRHGTLAQWDDETDAVYTEDLNKLDKLVGQRIFWEFRPYVKTAAGASSGVDEYRMAVAESDGEVGN